PGAAAAVPRGGPITLFVVDGTWSQAGKLLKLNPAIAALPRLSITPDGPSEYRIRRQPRAECLSTIEALATALGAIEGEPASFRAMLRPFRAMVEAQLTRTDASRTPRHLSRSACDRRPEWAPPHALRDASRVAIVAAETNAWPFDAKIHYPDEI